MSTDPPEWREPASPLTITVHPVGHVRTRYVEPSGAPIQTARNPAEPATLVVLDEYAAGLDDLDGFDYAILVAYMDRAAGAVPPTVFDADALRPVPFLLRDQSRRRGVFATRYPVRPNYLALSLVRIVAVEPPVVRFTGVDLADRTPILDIKPWVADFDVPAEVRAGTRPRCGWYDDLDPGQAG